MSNSNNINCRVSGALKMYVFQFLQGYFNLAFRAASNPLLFLNAMYNLATRSADASVGAKIAAAEVITRDKQAELDQKKVKDSIATANSCVNGATFLAGFAYYQIGRYGFTCFEDTTYIVFTTICFAISVLVAGIAGFYTFYLERIETIAEKIKFIHCFQEIAPRGIYRFHNIAVTFYILGLGRIGWVYYSTQLIKYLPFAFAILTVFLVWLVNARVVHSQFYLQSNNMFTMFLIDWKEMLRNSPYFNRKGNKLEEVVLKQSIILGGRAIYITNFAQNLVMRFRPCSFSPDDSTDDVTYVWPYAEAAVGDLYLLFAVLAFCSSIICGVGLLSIQIFLPDTDTEKQVAHAVLLMPLLKLCFLFYVFSFIAFGAAIMLVGYGASVSDFALMPFLFGFGTLLITTVGLCYTVYVRNKCHALRTIPTSALASTAPAELESSDDAAMKHQEILIERSFKHDMDRMNVAGSMCTYSGNALLYNIYTMQTDTLSLGINADNNNLFGSTFWFLLFNLSAEVASLLGAVLDSILTCVAVDLNTPLEREMFTKYTSWISLAITWLYKIFLLGWLAVFAFFGFVKFNNPSGTPSIVPAIYAGVGFVITLIFNRYLVFLYRRVKNSIDSAEDAEVKESNSATERPQLLNRIAGGTFFWGGFYAYYAINYFNFRTNQNTDSQNTLYLHGMSLCFVSSLFVLYVATDYNSKMSSCQTPAKKNKFAVQSRVIYVTCLIATLASVLSMLIAFSVQGSEKFNNTDQSKTYETYPNGNITYVIMGGAILGALYIVTFLLVVHYHYAQTLGQVVVDLPTAPHASHQHRRIAQQLWIISGSAAFIAGNASYEVLFSESLSSVPFFNTYYFLTTVGVFVLSLAAVSVAIIVQVALNELPSDEQREHFMQSMKGVKSLVFFLSSFSYLLWIAGCIALGEVKYKYKSHLWQPSFFICFYGLVYMLWTFYRIKVKSDDCVRREKDLFEVGDSASDNLPNNAANNSKADVELTKLTEETNPLAANTLPPSAVSASAVEE